ncbi:hypothetical protein RIR_jg33776.t1 [Rhizophagus irregularis DAOM 181602=DAOM 197198]|nr:hypothetical protein RIR_jg33776.t1 [Rhizophagus irregularis DAOM 181602=DAOM 197198]
MPALNTLFGLTLSLEDYCFLATVLSLKFHETNILEKKDDNHVIEYFHCLFIMCWLNRLKINLYFPLRGHLTNLLN